MLGLSICLVVCDHMLKSLYKPLAGIYNLGAFGVIGELVRL